MKEEKQEESHPHDEEEVDIIDNEDENMINEAI
jgi:hypothetical protein